MLNFKKSLVVAVALVLLCAGATAQAENNFGPSSIEAGRIFVKDIIHPLAPKSITQNTDPNTLIAGTSVACVGAQTTDNGWWRLFDLDAEFSLVGEYCTKNVDYGIETSVGLQNLAANVYCLDDGLPFLTVFLALAGSASQNQPDAVGEFFNIEVAGCCDSATQSMAVELRSDDCQETGTCTQLFIGTNDLGQSGPSYIAAADCGIVDPVDLAGLGFPDAHVVMVVNGNDEDTNQEGGGVPASTGLGMALMTLLLLGSSVYFLRRRAIN